MTKSLHRALDCRQGWDSCVELDPCARQGLKFWKNTFLTWILGRFSILFVSHLVLSIKSFALKIFTHLLSGCDVYWFTDNQAVPSIVHSGSMKEHLHILALDIFQTAKDNKIDIEVEWIPRTQNERADYLGKIVDYDDWTVKDCYFHAVTSAVWGPAQ